jgi:hypothetical protein
VKRISKWLKSKFSPYSVEEDEDHTPSGVKPEVNVKEENSGSDQFTALPIRTIPKESSYIVVESTGFDPYNSGTFEPSKLRSHK